MISFNHPETPYDLNFRVGQTPVRVHPFFWLTAAVLGWDWTRPPNNFGYLLLWIASVFLSVLLHELGHIWMGRVFGTRGHILLWSFGGLAIGSNDQRARWQRILVSFAGPGIQFAFYGVLWGFVRWGALTNINEDWRRPVTKLVEMLIMINWFWAILNLLPIWPLDGGMITRELCEGASPRKGRGTSLLISAIVSGILAAHCLMSEAQRDRPWAERGLPILRDYIWGDLFMGIFFALFCVQSIQAYQEERSRSDRWDDDDLPWER